MTTRNTTSYDWNYEKLKVIYEELKNKNRSSTEDREFQFLKTFIDINESIDDIRFNDNTNFAESFRGEFKTLFLDYYQFLPYIFDYYASRDDEISLQTLSALPFTDEEVFQSAHDFYQGLDKEWFKYFNQIYKQRRDFFKFSDVRSFSMYLPSQKIWLANVTREGTIGDFVDTVHEYAHGIADQISTGIRVYSPSNILIELFPIVCQMIFLNQNNIGALQVEISKYLNNYFKVMHNFAEEVMVKYNIAETFCAVKSARCLSRLVKRTWGFQLGKEDAQMLYSTPVEDNISYVFPFIVALELLDIYSKDPEKFKYLMNLILRTNDEPLDTLKKLKLTPNGVLGNN